MGFCFAIFSFGRQFSLPEGWDGAGLLGMVGEIVRILLTCSLRDGPGDVSSFGTCVRLFVMGLPEG